MPHVLVVGLSKQQLCRCDSEDERSNVLFKSYPSLQYLRKNNAEDRINYCNLKSIVLIEEERAHSSADMPQQLARSVVKILPSPLQFP